MVRRTMRRSLDKDYILTAILYTGASHSFNCIYNLVLKFNFKITHAYYSSIDLVELNNNFPKTYDIEEMQKIFYPPKITQCIEMDKFPPNFE